MRAYIDYLRLATFDSEHYTKLVSRIYPMDEGWRPGRWLQYAGKWARHFFHGVGEQGNRRHMIIQCSGDLAGTFAQLAMPYTRLYCTRIDIQRTIEKERDYDPRPVFETVRNIPGNRRTSSLVLSDSGSTVYFGNRTSDTFARLYEKEIDEHEFLRLEIEIKGITARDAWDNIRDENMRESEVYEELFHRFKLPDFVTSRFLGQEDGQAVYQLYEQNRFKNSKIQWLMSLENTLVKMGNDHQTGEIVKTFLENILEKIAADTT